MYNRIVLRSRATIRSHTHPSLYYASRTLATTGYSPPPNQPQTPRSPKAGGDRNGLYVGGGLAAIGALWYYFATTEKPHGRTGQQPQPAIDEAARAAKDGAQDVKGAAQSKAQGARERVSSEVEGGKRLYEEGKDEMVHRVSEARTAAGKRSELNQSRFG